MNGTMYAAARDITPKVMYINTKMFKDAGVEIPSEDWTMDDFVEVAKQLTKVPVPMHSGAITGRTIPTRPLL